MYGGHDRLVSEAVSGIAARTRCGMLHSEALAKVIHDDRVRQIERTTRERRMLQAPDEVESTAPNGTESARSFRVATPVSHGGSACEPA